MRQSGNKHWRWKNGRTLLSSGYIGIRVPVGHHLRMRNQYAYAHRIIAEQKLGRQLVKGELVHHINGIKTDNRMENIEILPSRKCHFFRHKVKHRKRIKGRRIPGQENKIVFCACGCGGKMRLFDGSGRPRKYLMGHWRKGKKGGWEKRGIK